MLKIEKETTQTPSTRRMKRDAADAHGLHERRVHRQVIVRRVVLLRPRLVERREDEGLVELVFY